jgi:hypothetical protein
MKVKHAIMAGTGILLIVLTAVGWYQYNRPHHNAGNTEASVNISAVELYQQYQQNETLANSKYLDKVIEVKGTVAEVQANDKSYIVLLQTTQPMAAVNCQFSNEQKENPPLAAKGENITIKGKCTGFLMDVNLVDCVIVPAKK